MIEKSEGPRRTLGQRAVRPRKAASLMIIRRDAKIPRVLMGRRHGGHRFMPDRWVFPGGRIDRSDYRAPYATDLRPDVQSLFDSYLPAGLGRALALAAVRETWEEAGLLLARPGEARATGPWQNFVAQGVLPDLEAMDVVARAITPPALAVRFDTWFLMAHADRLTSLERRGDCGELAEIAWMDFDDAMGLSLPTVTRLMLQEVAAQLKDPSRPKPFLRHSKREGGMRPVRL